MNLFSNSEIKIKLQLLLHNGILFLINKIDYITNDCNITEYSGKLYRYELEEELNKIIESNKEPKIIFLLDKNLTNNIHISTNNKKYLVSIEKNNLSILAYITDL